MEQVEVRYQVEGARANLVIDREAARNSLSAGVLTGLLDGLAAAEKDAAVRVVVLTGAGSRVFCAGGDLGSLSGDGFLDAHHGRRRYGELLLRLQNCAKPCIARVNGHALAGGLGLVLACDFAVMVESAALGTPEIDRGLFPMTLLALLQRQLGRKRALELVLLGERLEAKRALEWGLVNQVAPNLAELDAVVDVFAKKVAGKSQAILALGRRAFSAAEEMPLAQAVEFLASQLSLNVLTQDAAEGVTAFFEKRPAQWKDR